MKTALFAALLTLALVSCTSDNARRPVSEAEDVLAFDGEPEPQLTAVELAAVDAVRLRAELAGAHRAFAEGVVTAERYEVLLDSLEAVAHQVAPYLSPADSAALFE